jgi:hypothetical protein
VRRKQSEKEVRVEERKKAHKEPVEQNFSPRRREPKPKEVRRAAKLQRDLIENM